MRAQTLTTNVLRLDLALVDNVKSRLSNFVGNVIQSSKDIQLQLLFRPALTPGAAASWSR